MTPAAPPVAETRSTLRAWGEFLLAAPVVGLMTLLAWQVVDVVRAERLLYQAAQAAVEEAVLPRATAATINAAALRAVAKTRLADVMDSAIVSVNNSPVLLSPLELLQSGDRVQVTLGVYATDVVPDVLQPLGLSLAGRKLRAESTFIKP